MAAWYNRGKAEIANGGTDYLTGTIKVMLVTATYVFNVDHNTVSQITNELSGTGYVGGFQGSGRKLLASKAVTQDDVNNRAEFDAADVTWTAINAGVAAAAVMFRELTSDALSPLLAYLDFTGVTTNGGDLTLQWNAEGILQMS